MKSKCIADRMVKINNVMVVIWSIMSNFKQPRTNSTKMAIKFVTKTAKLSRNSSFLNQLMSRQDNKIQINHKNEKTWIKKKLMIIMISVCRYSFSHLS